MKILIVILLIFNQLNSGFAQIHRTVKVRAGSKVVDYFSQSEIYRYPEFTQGRVVFEDGKYSINELNYCILTGEMQFLSPKRDTMVIINENKIDFVEILEDTFYYDNGFLEVVDGKNILMAMKQYVKMSNIERPGALGSRPSGIQATPYSELYIHKGRNLHLTVPDDIVLSANTDFFIGTKSEGFTLYKKKRVMQLFPDHNTLIENFINEQNIDFKDKEKLILLTDYLQTLKVVPNYFSSGPDPD